MVLTHALTVRPTTTVKGPATAPASPLAAPAPFTPAPHQSPFVCQLLPINALPPPVMPSLPGTSPLLFGPLQPSSPLLPSTSLAPSMLLLLSAPVSIDISISAVNTILLPLPLLSQCHPLSPSPAQYGAP